MNVHDVARILREHDVPSHYYTFGGLGQGECYGIENDPAGWTVYFSERGTKSVLCVLKNEDEACRKLLGYIAAMVDSKVLRGL